MWLDKYIRTSFEATEDVVVITGGAIGVDLAVESYCERVGIMNLKIAARWLELGEVIRRVPYSERMQRNPAGLIRNRHIIDLADEFYAFWDGESPGTAHAIKCAKKKSGMIQKVFSVKTLRRELGIRPPRRIKLPPAPITDDIHRFPSGVKVEKKGKYLKKRLGKDSIKDLIKMAGL